MQILTHRWLEPGNKNFLFDESSQEAFEDHLKRWYWVEFDVNFTQDGYCFIFHDSSLGRISNELDKRAFLQLKKDDIKNVVLPKWGHLISLHNLLEMIELYRNPGEFSALHLKEKFQKQEYLSILMWELRCFPSITEKVFIFDAKIKTAEYLKISLNTCRIFPSVAHPYDIHRYGWCTWNTLYSIEEVIERSDIFSGVWLDEWDRKDFFWKTKKFYTKEVIDLFRGKWFLIALVTPDLHWKSPWLLWWESHEDSVSMDALQSRFKEIVDLRPDFICSDHLEYASSH